MQIVITDGYTLNPGDLSWQAFENLGDLKYYDRTLPAEVADRCREATVIITNKTPITSNTINAAPQLKLIAVTATGYNIVDINAARDHGVLVCNVPEYGTNSVAQHTFALLLELTNHTGKHAASVAQGDWAHSADWSYVKAPVAELNGKTMGIVGFGRIGQKVAEIAKAFGMNVITYNKGKQTGLAVHVSLQDLFTQSDVVSLHCPLKEDNYGFVNRKLLSLMKPTAFLINTSRGQLVNEDDLAGALRQHVLAAAALDVLSTEPPAITNPLIGLPNCIITPHNAWVSVEARRRLMQATLDNIQAALNGKPVNIVNS
jgi:glycerate dehydrogenase